MQQMAFPFYLNEALLSEGIVLQQAENGCWYVDWGSNISAFFTDDYETSVRTAYDLYILGKRPLSEFEKRMRMHREKSSL